MKVSVNSCDVIAIGADTLTMLGPTKIKLYDRALSERKYSVKFNIQDKVNL